MSDKNTRYLGVPCRSMPPTLKHRPAVWENMLGTVYAMNDAGQTEYFDYDHDAAKAFAGVESGERDLRLARAKVNMNGMYSHQLPSKGKLVLWIKKGHS